MIQCDICLCWQHGLCLGIDDEDQVPDKHVCEFCKNPKAARSSAKYALDQDWLKEGRLPSVNKPEAVVQGENAFKKLSELMADLANLNKVLHSLRLKLQVASQTNSGKVFMWSMLWDAPPTIKTFSSTTATSTTLDERPFVDEKFDPTAFGKFDPQAVIDKLKMKLGAAATAAGGDPFFCSNNQSYLSNNACAPHLSNSVSEAAPMSSLDACQNLFPPHLLTPQQQQNQQQQDERVKPNCDISNCQSKDPNQFDEMSSQVVSRQAITTNGTTATTATATAEENKNNFEQFDESKKRSIDQSGDNQQQQQQLQQQTPNDEEMDKEDLSLNQGQLEEDQLRDSMEVCNEHLDEVSGPGEDSTFDISLIPTFSEVAQLLPSVIEAMGSSEGAGNGSESPPPTLRLLPPPQPRVLIQEPKRITRDDCRLNLLDHICSVQSEIELRLDTIESGLSQIVDEAGSNPVPQTPRTRSMLTNLIRDLSTARTLMWSLK